ncbi:MAG: ThiF family adenylyltransferase [Chloroflexi bacterium]|nr:ThiF family adenylyltransferase [Chloroflexota bacterium]
MGTSDAGRALEKVEADALLIPRAKEFADYLGAAHIKGAQLSGCWQSSDRRVEWLEIEVTVSVPQRPVHDIRAKEEIAIRFLSDDHVPPGVFSPRPDFPYAPHTNLQNAGEYRSLCLYDQPWHEVKFDWTGARFLGRIVWWLEGTAHGTLHQPDQPLEPLLLGSYSDLVVPSSLLSLPRLAYSWAQSVRVDRLDGEYTLLLSELTGLPKTGVADQYTVVVMQSRPMTHGLIHSTPRTLGELDGLLSSGRVNVIQQLQEIFQRWERRLSSPQLAGVLSTQLLIVIRLPKRRRYGGPVEYVEIRAFRAEESVGIIGARLGIQWRGTVNNAGNPQTRLTVLNVREVLTRQMARRSNGLSEVIPEPQVVAIGAGAIGSPVLTNLTRSGYGKFTIVDEDVLHPHNLARHSLSASYLGWHKADALAAELSSIMPEEPPVRSIVANVLMPGEKSGELEAEYRDSDLILDMAASIPVSRHLVHDIRSEARRVSLFLNPSGSALTVLAEDAGREIQLDSLEMQFYRALVKDNSLGSLLDNPSRNRTGQTCRDLSAEISQNDVVMHSGMGSRAVQRLAENDRALVRTWLLDENDNYLLVMDLEPAAPVKITREDWTVIYDSELLDRLAQMRESRLPNETGGVLIGSRDRTRKILYVVDALPSPSDSEELKTSYIRGTKGLSEEVERIANITGSNLDYIGEWHSHPDGNSVKPSANDQRLLNWIRSGLEETGETGLMCIIGEGRELGVYL